MTKDNKPRQDIYSCITDQIVASLEKGLKGSPVVYASSISKTEIDEQEDEHAIPFMKGYTVFNVDQIDGLQAPPRQPPRRVTGPITAEIPFDASRPSSRRSSGSSHIGWRDRPTSSPAIYLARRQILALPS